jgi:DNA-binding response OmpR family regulator
MAIRVLLADDEQEFTAILAKVLRRRGLQVEIRSDADGAIDAVRQQPFDVILLDVKMPGKSGMEALAELHRMRPELPVILLTGHFAVEEEREGLAAGAHAYLLKPHPVLDLVARIEQAAAGRPATPPHRSRE